MLETTSNYCYKFLSTTSNYCYKFLSTTLSLIIALRKFDLTVMTLRLRFSYLICVYNMLRAANFTNLWLQINNFHVYKKWFHKRKFYSNLICKLYLYLFFDFVRIAKR